MRSSHSTAQLSTGYVPPHLRPKKNNGAVSTEDITNMTKLETHKEEFPTLCQPTEPKKALSGWGKKSFADLLKTEQQSSEEKKSTEYVVLSSTIEVVHDEPIVNEIKKQIVVVEVDDWTTDL
jgi:hypothetical protein